MPPARTGPEKHALTPTEPTAEEQRKALDEDASQGREPPLIVRGGIVRRPTGGRADAPFTVPIIGGALRAMAEELAMRVPRGSREDGLPRPGYVRRGRRLVVTPEVGARILELRRDRLGYKRIAHATGISVTTVRRFLDKAVEER